jgi:hypothetical protein
LDLAIARRNGIYGAGLSPSSHWSRRASLSGEFDLDCDRLAAVPLTETVQPIGKIFERSVLQQHE